MLITGASSGIGRDLAVRYSKAGANVALLARRARVLDELAVELRSMGIEAIAAQCDVTDREACRKAIADVVAKFERIDVVILNAGVSMGCYFEDIKSLDDAEYMLRLNIMGQINIVHYALPYIPKRKESRIVAVSSVAGVVGVPFRTVYCASKWALTGFCASLRTELLDAYGYDSPQVVVTCPPEVDTGINSNRLEFGAGAPAIFSSAVARPVAVASESIMQAVADGQRLHLFERMHRILHLLYAWFPSFIDRRIIKIVKKTHIHARGLARL